MKQGIHPKYEIPLFTDAALEPEFPAVGDTSPAPESDGPRPDGRFGPQLTAALELATALVPCGLGTGLAYYFAGSLNQDPFISAVLGGVTGLLLERLKNSTSKKVWNSFTAFSMKTNSSENYEFTTTVSIVRLICPPRLFQSSWKMYLIGRAKSSE